MSWKQSASVLPGIDASLLPKVVCQACWPAYAGLLSSLGLGFVPLPAKYLLPLTAVFLIIAAAALGFRARKRRGRLPMLLGALASAVVLSGKFSLNSNLVMDTGLVMLIAASAWNAWPQRKSFCCPEPGQPTGNGGIR